MRFYWPIAKLDHEQRMVWGYASTEAEDEQGEVIRRDALAAALADYMRFANIREMHQPSAVGIAEEAAVDERGLYLGAPRRRCRSVGQGRRRRLQGLLDRRPGHRPRPRRPQGHHRPQPDRNLDRRPPGQPRGGVRLLETRPRAPRCRRADEVRLHRRRHRGGPRFARPPYTRTRRADEVRRTQRAARRRCRTRHPDRRRPAGMPASGSKTWGRRSWATARAARRVVRIAR
jgi:hypothetical protein